MADNVTANPGVAGAVFASDDIGGIHHPYAKLEWGPDGTANIVDIASGKMIPVQLRDATGALITKAEDTAAVAGDFGLPILAVRRDADTTLVGTDNDYANLQVNAAGSLKVAITAGAGSGGTSIADDAPFTVASTSVTPVGGTYKSTVDSVDDGDAGAFHMTVKRALHTFPVDANGVGWTLGAGAVAATTPRMTHASDDPTVTSLQLLDDVVFAEDVAAQAADKGVAILAVRRDANTSLVGTDNDYAQLQVSALGALKVCITEDSVGSSVDSDDGTVAGGQATVALTIGLTQVWDGSNWKRVAADTPLFTSPAHPANFVSGCISSAMTGTTSTSLVAAPGASLRNYITTIIASCAHATQGTDILIQDGSGGTTLAVIPAAALYGGAAITLPVPLRQPTTNTAIYCANVTTGSSTKVTAMGYKGA